MDELRSATMDLELQAMTIDYYVKVLSEALEASKRIGDS